MRTVQALRVGARALAVMAVAVTSACSSATSGSGQPPTTPFVVARTGDVGVLDPARAATSQAEHTLDLVYDTLLNTDEEGRLAPGLATRWRVSDGGTVLTFALRRGVAFHNGAAFTAADAKATLKRLVGMGRRGPHSPPRSFQRIESLGAPDPHTLVVRLSQPHTALLTALTSVRASILDSDDIDAGTVARQPNGTGPFRWISGERAAQRAGVTLAANAGYWNGAPKLARLQLRTLPDEAAVLSAVQAGDAHLGLVSDPRAVHDAASRAIQVREQFTLSFYALVLDGRDGPLNQRRVRQALACAVDRQQVIEEVFLGHGTVTGPIISPAYRYDPTGALPCDSPGSRTARNQARALLAEAGHPGGFALRTAVPSGNRIAVDVAASLQAQLARIGVRLRPGQRTAPGTANPPSRGAQAAVVRRHASYDPYLTYAPFFLRGGMSPRPANPSGWRVGALLRRANSTADAQQRQQIFRGLQRQMLRRSPWVWLVREPAFYLLGADVRGFRPTPTQSLEHLRSTWLSESSESSE